jgi:hypothetical protein
MMTMVSRLIGLLLGLILAAAGYIIVQPLGSLVPPPPALSLGEFEGLRVLIGWGALALGGLAVLANLWPGRPKKRSQSVRDRGLAPITFSDDPAPTPVNRAAEPAPLTLAPLTFAPEAPVASAPVVAAPVAPAAQPLSFTPVPSASPLPPRVEGPPQETFGQLREKLRNCVRSESWSEAGRILARLPRLALTHRDRMLAAQDLGDFARSQGRTDDAADAYGEALSYARLMHDIEPTDPIASADLAGALINIGDTANDEGRLDAALGAYEEAVALRRRMVTVSQSKRSDRRALTIALERLADAREDRGHRVRALDLYRESAEIVGVLASEDPQRFGADLNGTRSRLSELEARLAI